MKLSPSPRLVSLLALAAFASSVHAEDTRFGGARTFGLAGAGIALPLDVYETHTVNPALLGFASKRFRFGIPYVGYHTDHISLGQVNDLVDDTSSGGVSDDTAVKLARKYGSETKEFGLNAGFGLSVANFAFSGSGEVIVRSVPNQQLKAFLATNDDNYQNTPIDARLDAYGLGYYQGEASFGHEVPLGTKVKDRLALGVTVREITAFYAHKIADGQSIADNGDVRNGTEISGSDDVVRRSGVGVDLGAVGSVHSLPDAYFGFNVHNAIEPDVKFVRTTPDTDFPLHDDLRPFRREIGVGAAYVKTHYLVALDAVDLGNNASNAGFRIGAEYSLNKLLAVRGGFDTHTKFVVGVCLAGVNLAISADGTTSLASTLRF